MEFMSYDSDKEKHRVHDHIEKTRALADVRVHSINQMIESLDLAGAEALMVLLASISSATEPRSSAAYWQGLVAHALQVRFGICNACGKNHDEDLREMSGQAPPSAGEEQLEIPTPIGSTTPLTPWEVNTMREYGLFARYTPGGALEGFGCRNCGMAYVSIADRTLKASSAAGCPGCIEKAKFG